MVATAESFNGFPKPLSVAIESLALDLYAGNILLPASLEINSKVVALVFSITNLNV